MGRTDILNFNSLVTRDAGMDSATPAALIENGCCPDQPVAQGRLHELEALVEREQMRSPAPIVDGDVVRLADQLSPAVLANEGLQVDIQQIRKLSA